MKRIESSINSIIWIYVFNGVSSIMPFIIRTLIINYWGIEYLGLGSLFSSVLQILNLSELGIGNAILVSLYKPVAEKNYELVNKLLSLYAIVYTILGGIILVCGLMILPVLPKLISGTYPSDINIYVVYIIYLLQTVFSYFPFAVCSIAFTSGDKMYISYRRSACVLFITYVFQIIIICTIKNYYIYSSLFVVSTILTGALNYFAMRRIYPKYHLKRINRYSFSELFWVDFIKRIVAMALSKMRNVFRNSIDCIIVSSFLGLVVLAKYQNYLQIMAVPILMVGAIMGGVLPALGNSVAIESVEKNYYVVKQISFVNHWISTVFSCFLICYYQPFMRIWVGIDNVLSEEFMIMIVAYFYLRSISEVPILVRNSSGIWWEGKWIAVFESIANLILNLYFVKIWGIEGIILATIITMVLINIPLETYYIYRYYFKKPVFRDLVDYLKNGIVTSIILFVTYEICDLYHGGWVDTFAIYGVVCLIIPNILLYLFHLKNNEMIEVRSQIIGLIIKYIVKSK